MKKKVIVGLSGGVDSSVCAFLLNKNNEYIIEAAFMRNWDSILNNDILGNDNLSDEICTQEQDYQDAIEVAKLLNLKLHRIDFISEYWNYVFKYFIDEYKQGRTPNPDILCNKYIKFHEFLNYVIKNHQADYIAMGHYARVIYNRDIKEFQLLKGLDQNKDQSYFLCMLTQEQLSKSLFPVGDLKKEVVRKIAADNNLITANKKDSTGICFIGERNFKEFLKNYIPSIPGNIVDIKTKEIVGQHDGIMYYTVGQRRGINLSGMKNRYFVVGKNINEKILYVASENEKKWLYSNRAIITNINFINKIDKNIINCSAIFRYRQMPVNVILKKITDTSYEVNMSEKVKAVVTGQFAVFYDNDICLGGGIISSVFNDKIKLEYFDF